MGRPLIACDVPGCRDVVRHGENGLLVEVNNPGSLAAGMLALCESPERLAPWGAAARRWVQDNFGIDRVNEITLAAYSVLIGTRTGDRKTHTVRGIET